MTTLSSSNVCFAQEHVGDIASVVFVSLLSLNTHLCHSADLAGISFRCRYPRFRLRWKQSERPSLSSRWSWGGYEKEKDEGWRRTG